MPIPLLTAVHTASLLLATSPTSPGQDATDAPDGPDDGLGAAVAGTGPSGPRSLLTTDEILLLAAQVGVAAVLAYAAAVVVGAVLRRAGRRSPLVGSLSHRLRRPFRALVVLVSVRAVLAAANASNDWAWPVGFAVGVAVIAAAAWLLVGATFVAEDEVLRRYRVDVDDNRRARRVRTQASLLRRLVVTAVVVVAVGVLLLTIPGVSRLGTTLLASAGLLSVVAGLAAQTALGNVFAGLQLAFTDALRVEDVVVVETQFGRVEEITLTYVVVRLWDERRMVLPSTWFTTNPFENWTRRESQLLGTVLLEVDWRTDVDAVRAELDRVLSEDDLWDGRVGVVQVTDAVGSVVQLRALVSGADAAAVFDLRCHVREALVAWLVAHPAALPRTRQENSEAPALGAPGTLASTGARREPTGWELPDELPVPPGVVAHGQDLPTSDPGDQAARRAGPAADGVPGTAAGTGDGRSTGSTGQVGAREPRNDSLFTGSPEAEERSRQFSGPRDDDRAPLEQPATTGSARALATGDDDAHRSRGAAEQDRADEGGQPPTAVVPAVEDRAASAAPARTARPEARGDSEG